MLTLSCSLGYFCGTFLLSRFLLLEVFKNRILCDISYCYTCMTFIFKLSVNCSSTSMSVVLVPENHVTKYMQQIFFAFRDELPTSRLCYTIVHDYGLATGLHWCPAHQDQPVESGAHPRLGLLAISCTDGTVRVFR